MSTASFKEYRLALQAFQSKRLRHDHADLAAEPQYQLIGEFFFTEMYGPRDYSNRDEQARRLQQFIHIVPGVTVRDIEPVLQLLELTNLLDDQITHMLIEQQIAITFDEATYDRLYRECDNYRERLLQLELIRDAIFNVYRTARSPVLKLALQGTEAVANALGLGDIHRFFRLGHRAIQPVRDVNRFCTTIYGREKDRLDRVYADHLASTTA